MFTEQLFRNFRFSYLWLLTFFKHRLVPSKHSFHEHSSTSTTLVTCLNAVVLSRGAQEQVGSLYFDLGNAFVLHSLLLLKLAYFKLLSGPVNWFHTYLASRLIVYSSSGILSFSYVVKFRFSWVSTL